MPPLRLSLPWLSAALILTTSALASHPIRSAGQPAELDVRVAGTGALRVTLKPRSFAPDFPDNPALPARDYPRPVLSLREIGRPVRAEAAGMVIEARPDPLRLVFRAQDGTLIQTLTFRDDGVVDFALDDQPVLGMGEGGPLPPKDSDWRQASPEFDRRGRLFKMQPRWQSDAYGSRNPVGLLVGTRGWGLYFASPWGQFDLREADSGRFLPVKADPKAFARQDFSNQTSQLGKGRPPFESMVPGLVDVFVFDARRPEVFMKDVATLAGAAVMPPKWALGYMQSHRTLADDAQMLGLVDTFREKRIPIDAVIYLGTGFTPRGWNTQQPSFEFNPEVFKRDPVAFIDAMHQRHTKVVLHIVPWDRDRLPVLHGSIPPRAGEAVGPGHIADYWRDHLALVAAGVDGWWPDEGDWLDLHERMKRHQLYHEGPISTQPDRRPWSLHRNGHLGVARWGGWMWSGDTDSSWKTLETQIAVGLNHSLSVGPYWGTDLGGFFSTPELTGELYARWFQFAAFCPSFRAHGRTWWTRLPWGWGLPELGPVEDPKPPLTSELGNPAIEPIARRYAELRYRLLSYNYTLAWQARETGLPFMRALWLHHPDDPRARATGDEYLWGRDLLIAPVFQKGATQRSLYLPAGAWYDWWTNERHAGGRTLVRDVDLATMPIYVRAGAIIPVDPVRQFTAEQVDEPLTVRIYRGADGDYTLYEDDGESLAYLRGKAALTRFHWDDATATLTLRRDRPRSDVPAVRTLRIELLPEGTVKTVEFTGRPLEVSFR